ncbi:hypothetical protein SARC_10274 [Sphaeroforma arctica JP610]|uniref:Uncharacterized protein n=1 Tax=Sphaeroforma arctica JP610 TaxID=667725 RepID=A0A0L0FKH8_9EUKA|nr:hypothetical protein SARC_10274 [Sphaeroforma arctica JP610]KNC77265.1 hypothetical protein SARC_10274 [Sphaeroforma arctica JP610]|eukprot:XP_014151167.1 hypothetical protein SARC_10274 [Sphaeroforma arctica JP610]
MANITDSKTSVLFDFDGTLCDSETPAMEVAYIELAPYLGVPPTPETMLEFIRANAGKAFEFMIEAADEERKSKNETETCEESRANKSEPKDIMSVINPWREKLGLKPLAETNPGSVSLLTLQKEDTLVALGNLCRPVDGCLEVLQSLNNNGLSYCIATTSGKPRVPVCVDAANIRNYFPTDDFIHSGESDFTPPRFKPAPDVYMKAANAQGKAYEDCVAVEDSGSGVGSAANAKLGLIVGYVGAGHIAEAAKDEHAKMLMSGGRSENGRGAAIVLRNLQDLLPIVYAFEKFRKDSPDSKPSDFNVADCVGSIGGQHWLP